ncbi:MAG: TM0106 family RecB-like putative nuclease [Symploca sp. SIO2B6]|nr:TM0106 family RecB-like putative nuclease [Symploca sp. SIO2B6]
MLLTDELLLDYKRCRRRAFLDTYRDSAQQDSKQDFLLKLLGDSRDYKQAVITSANYKRPSYPWGDWEAGAKATRELMQQGTERIAGAVLLTQLSEEVTLLSTPDLLEQQPGQSNFGDWIYVPTNIKLGRRPKQEYKILSAFCAQILTAIQGAWPTTAWLILRRPNPYAVNLETSVPLMQELVLECIDTLLQRQEPEVFISRQKCSFCHWYSSCYAIAQQEQHISLLPGVTPRRYQDLQALGVTTVESLAASTISTLEPALEPEVALNLVTQAKSTVHKQALLTHKPLGWETTSECDHGNSLSWFAHTNDLLTAPIELYFDIEALPDLNLDYLLGVLVVDKLNHTENFHCLLAEHPDDEALIWKQFLALVGLYPEAPIFHFSEYEAETVKRLGLVYSTPQLHLETLLSRFVDVHKQVMDTVKLPVESYSLKHLARWVGFEWRDAQMNGSQTVCLYDQWLNTGNRSCLDAIQRYNEDDCRATYKLKDWLAKFLISNK